jgi:hypothetical protein
MFILLAGLMMPATRIRAATDEKVTGEIVNGEQ